MDHGEHPNDTVVRELEEETGYDIEVTGFLGMDSIRHVIPWSYGREVDQQGLRLVYEARVVGGELRHEIGGSTDMAAWHPLDDVPGLTRVGLIDIALKLWRERPAVGRVERAPE